MARQRRRRPHFTAEEILRQLDDCAESYTFPMLDNGYVYPGDVRLSGYSDASRWALVIEVIGFSYRVGLPSGLDSTPYRFGNCLDGPPGIAGSVAVIDNDPDHPAFEQWGNELLPGAKWIRVRGQAVPVPALSTLAAKGIKPRDPRRLRGEELLRGLLPEYRHLLLTTEAELRQRVPADLPLVIRLNEWHHPNVAADDLPSQSLTFRRVAEALVGGDPNSYRPPDDAPNTHWKNWPRGGTL